MENYENMVSNENQKMMEGQVVYREKTVPGLVGALLGSLIGTICIVLLGELGYIASLSGVVMGICSIKGYQLLGKGMSLKGIIIVIVIMIIMVYMSNWISYALAAADVFETDVFTAFLGIPSLLKEGVIEGVTYYKDLGMLYLFTALGAVPTIRDIMRQ